MCSNVMWSYYK